MKSEILVKATASLDAEIQNEVSLEDKDMETLDGLTEDSGEGRVSESVGGSDRCNSEEVS
jgi:hypothetical protein